MSHEHRTQLPAPPALPSATSSAGANSPYSIIEADVRFPPPLALAAPGPSPLRHRVVPSHAVVRETRS